jgi:PAS domain S-box-containing protein
MTEHLLNPAYYQTTPDSILLLVTALACLITSSLGARREGGVIGRALLILGLTVVMWFFAAFFLRCSREEQIALWWARAIYIGVPLMPAALFHFTVLLLKSYNRYQRLVWAGWLAGVMFAFLFTSTDIFINGVRLFSWGYRPRFTPAGIVYLGFFFAFIWMSVLLYFRDYRTSAPGSIQRKRSKLLLIAYGISSGGFVDYLSNLNIPVYPFGFLPMLATIFFMGFTLWNFRLVDITPQFAAQQVLDTMNDALLVLDADGIIRLMNHGAANLFGSAEQGLLGKHISTLIDDPLYVTNIAGSAGTAPILRQEFVLRPRNAPERVLDLSLSAMKEEGDRSVAHVLIARDITHIKQAEAALRSARDELEARVEERSSELRRTNEQLAQEKYFSESIIDNLPGIFYICDEQGRLIRWNSNEKELTGYTRQELARMDVFQLFATDRERLARNLREAMETGQTALEASLVSKTGALVQFYVTGYRMTVNDKRYMVGVGIDISERKKLEEQFRQAQKMEAVGLLAGGVAHDFNNILSAIIGYSHLTLMKIQDEELRHNVEMILESSERAAALTQNLLAFSRKQPIHPEIIDLNAVLKGLTKLLRHLIREDIALATVFSEQELWINADKIQIEQVILNLVTNARDAMPEGGRLSIETNLARPERAPVDAADNAGLREYACISVSDTGIGMDNRTASRVFEPFFTTKEQGKGTGLGLSTAYGIVKKHDGFIECRSRAGHGTAFFIYLPIVGAQAGESAPAVPSTQESLRGTETILVAEDDETLRRLSVKVLGESGYSVIEAVDGSDAVAKFRENSSAIRLVILDGIMPKMRGMDAYRQIKALNPAIKCIFMSSYADDIFENADWPYGMPSVLLKPTSPGNFLMRVREELDK